MDINWKNYVDHIYCIHATILTSRYNDLIETLDYSNIRPSGIFDFILDKIPDNRRKSYRRLFRNHYLASKYCVKNNFNRILVLEDDIRVLDDDVMIKRTLDNIPDSFNICLLDYNIPVEKMDNPFTGKINNYYCSYESLYSTAAYIINRPACEMFVNDYECRMYDGLFSRVSDAYFNEMIDNKITVIKNLFVQYEYSNKITNFDLIGNYINRNKIKLEDYHNYIV